MKGYLQKMKYQKADTQLAVSMLLGGEELLLNEVLGKRIKLEHNGKIHCANCSSKTSKSYGGGYCYRCFMKLPECDMCILKPETCHRAAGTCRNNNWSDNNCMRSHLVYLAFTSEVKIGITRSLTGLPRWYDQGAICAMPLGHVPDRLAAGEIEVFLKQKFSDKSKWKQMLTLDLSHEEASKELRAARIEAIELLKPWFLEHQFDRLVLEPEVTCFNYPLLQGSSPDYSRVTFNKQDTIEGVLCGVKGQYLILDSGVVNIRSHTGYQVELTVS